MEGRKELRHLFNDVFFKGGLINQPYHDFGRKIVKDCEVNFLPFFLYFENTL